jgi:hypothetical protein
VFSKVIFLGCKSIFGRGWKAEQLLGAVLHEKQGGYDAQDAQHAGRPNSHKMMEIHGKIPAAID